MKKSVLGIALICILPACSSILEGTSQEIMVNTNPSGADCALIRQGNSIAHITPTPGATTIKKTKYDITIVCNKDGYQEATYLNHSGAAGATFGNIAAGGPIGWAIDSASGADNKYDSPVNLTLAPVERDSKGNPKPSSFRTINPNQPSVTPSEAKPSTMDNWPGSETTPITRH